MTKLQLLKSKPLKTNLQYVDPNVSKWLYEEALSAASNLSPINIIGIPCTRQLVLVRFTDQLISNGFVYSDIFSNGKMWTNTVTCRGATTFKLTGFNSGAARKALNVVRIGLNESFFKNPQNLIEAGRTQIGFEYELKFDIPLGAFATIPLHYETANDLYLQANEAGTAFNSQGWLRSPRQVV